VPISQQSPVVCDAGEYDHYAAKKKLSALCWLNYVGGLSGLGKPGRSAPHAEDRLKLSSDNFVVHHAGNYKGADVVLVDDVVTTGGTLEGAAKRSLKGGAKSSQRHGLLPKKSRVGAVSTQLL